MMMCEPECKCMIDRIHWNLLWIHRLHHSQSKQLKMPSCLSSPSRSVQSDLWLHRFLRLQLLQLLPLVLWPQLLLLLLWVQLPRSDQLLQLDQ